MASAISQPDTFNSAGEPLFAVLSDIHGNYAALCAVVKDAEQIARTEQLAPPVFLCLGDFVDYGPQPNECMAWVMHNRKRIALVLGGNHDADVCRNGWYKPQRVGHRWWAITLWSRLHLEQNYRRLLAELPEVADGPPGLEEFHCYHSTPWNVGNYGEREGDLLRDGYIGGNVEPEQVLRQLGCNHMHGLFGHTHYQVMFVKHGNRAVSHYAQPETRRRMETDREVNIWHEFPKIRSTLINPGSVGQPRLHANQYGMELGSNDPRAAYLLLHRHLQDGESHLRFQWRRVPYDLEQTRTRLQNLAWTSQHMPSADENEGIFVSQEVEELKTRLTELTMTLVRYLGENNTDVALPR